jgi:DNA-binding NtrC family response regulator
MSIGLFAPSHFPAAAVAEALGREGRTAISIEFDPQPGNIHVPEDVVQGVLIQMEQGVVTLGEQANRARAVLGEERQLLLCCPQPTPADRQTLIECGADNVATPASWASVDVAERILAEIILEEGPRANSSGALFGGTRVMHELYRDIKRLAPLDDGILILGETGTGKELVANELHRQSPRGDKFMAINCAELSPELLGSELFGHEKGAFTNALQARKGLLLEARKGSVLLDEIGDLDLQAQAKLLRVIEERKVRPVGSNQWFEFEARLILATNHNVEEESRIGTFRPDLQERIRGFTLILPPLRTRKADIPLLVQHFVAEYSNDYNLKMNVPAGAIDCLFRYDWEGNVRELRAVVRKAAAYADESHNLSAVMLQEAISGRKRNVTQNSVSFDPASDSWREVQKRTQAAYLRSVLMVANGNKEVAARMSGLSRAQFYEKLKEIE